MMCNTLFKCTRFDYNMKLINSFGVHLSDMSLLKRIPDGHAIVFPVISTEPHQPRNFNFPKIEFDKKSVESKKSF